MEMYRDGDGGLKGVLNWVLGISQLKKRYGHFSNSNMSTLFILTNFNLRSLSL